MRRVGEWSQGASQGDMEGVCRGGQAQMESTVSIRSAVTLLSDASMSLLARPPIQCVRQGALLTCTLATSTGETLARRGCVTCASADR